MRIFEFAHMLGVPSKEVLELLRLAGFDISSHMTMASDEMLVFLEKKYNLAPEKEKSKQAEGNMPQIKSIEENTPDLKNPKIIIKPMFISEISKLIKMSESELILFLLKQGQVFTKNQVLPKDLVKKLLNQSGLAFEEERQQELIDNALSKRAKLVEGTKRLPVAVVVGHVNHGKTTLLDFIRKTKVADKEAGGITQHLGAYKVPTRFGDIVFLDTPGHEAFTLMRTRGLKAADIVILVVAVDDGVMPQTIEAIKTAQSLSVPIIVALNKIDRAGLSKIENIKTQLSQYGVLSEEWGGDTVLVPISAKTGQGIDSLLEMTLLQTDLMDLVAMHSGPAKGYVLDVHVEKGRGKMATFIGQDGELKLGDFFICGKTSGKISSILNMYGKSLNSVGPSIPVKISGFDDLPKAGDLLEVAPAADFRRLAKEIKKDLNLEAIAEEKNIKILIKADTYSSQEVISSEILKKFKKDGVVIVYSGVGHISESDIALAAALNARIYGFGIKFDVNARDEALKKNVLVYIFDVIYNLFDDIARLIKSKEKVQVEKKKIGRAIVKKVFKIKNVGVIAGFSVADGKILKSASVEILRNGQKIGSGPIKSLQREKRSMKEVSMGYEGALAIEGFTDWMEGDVVECFIEVPISS